MEAVDATPVFISIPRVVMERVFESLGPSQELPLVVWEEEDCVPHWYGELVFGWKIRRRLALSCKACHTASRHWKCFIRLGVPKAYLRSPERNEVEDVQQLALAELARARLWAPEAPLWKCCMTARPKNGHPGDMSLVEFDCIHPLYRIREFCRPGGRLWRTKDSDEVEDQYKYVNMFDDTCRLMFVIGELAIRDQQARHNDVWCDESQGTSDAVSVSFLGVL
jgi:hypothetical protein